MRECEICGRSLRTGRKYCYDCKSGGRLSREKEKGQTEIATSIVPPILGFVSYYFFKRGEIINGIIFSSLTTLLVFALIYKFIKSCGKRSREF